MSNRAELSLHFPPHPHFNVQTRPFFFPSADTLKFDWSLDNDAIQVDESSDKIRQSRIVVFDGRVAESGAKRYFLSQSGRIGQQMSDGFSVEIFGQ